MESARLRVGLIGCTLAALVAAGCGVSAPAQHGGPSIDPDPAATNEPTPTPTPNPDPTPTPTNSSPSAPDAGASTVDAVPASALADGKVTAIVTVTVLDRSRRPVPGATVTLASSAAATITPPSVKSSASGVAVFNVASTTAASHVLTATVDGGGSRTTLAQTPTVVFTAPSWSVGGTVVGLTGTGLTLATAGQANLVVGAGATSFRFGKEVPSGTAYAISIVQPPSSPTQRCTIANERGTVGSAAVTSPAVTCVDEQTTSASLTLSTSSVTLDAGTSTAVTALAVKAGGAVATVTAVAADASIVGVSVTNGASSSTVTLNALKAGTTTVTVTNAGDPSAATNSKTVAVTVVAAENLEGYGAISGRLYPAPRATAAYADGELSITFDAAPTLGANGSIEIYGLSDGAQVDTISYANESQTVSGKTINVKSQLVRVSGNTLYFTPHFGKLAYGASYYVGIASGAIGGTLNGKSFSGFSNQKTVASWRFTTRAAPSIGATITVDGAQSQTSAHFRTLGGALMYLAAHAPAGNAVRIDVAKGTYVELVHYRAATPNPNLTVTIRGPAGNSRGDSCVVQYTNGGSWNAQPTRASFYFRGANLVLENLTLRNTGVRSTETQAEALYFDSGGGYTMAANNCTFSSHQDTVNTTGRTWVYNSRIEGNTDFIWGTADVSLFERCDLRVINDAQGQTYSIFVARTGATGAATVGKGYVLKDSTVTVDAGIKAAFGRNAGKDASYDQVALVNNKFTGSGTLASGLWVTTNAPSMLGDATYVGWKAAPGNTGLGAESAATASGTAKTIASQSSEYDTRDHILNRVVAVTNGAPTTFANASSRWDTASLAQAWGAP